MKERVFKGKVLRTYESHNEALLRVFMATHYEAIEGDPASPLFSLRLLNEFHPGLFLVTSDPTRTAALCSVLFKLYAVLYTYLLC